MRWGIRPNQLPQHEAWLMLLKMDSPCKTLRDDTEIFWIWIWGYEVWGGVRPKPDLCDISGATLYDEVIEMRLWGMRWGKTQAWSVWYIWSNLVWWSYWGEVVRYEMREDPSLICEMYLEQPLAPETSSSSDQLEPCSTAQPSAVWSYDRTQSGSRHQ